MAFFKSLTLFLLLLSSLFCSSNSENNEHTEEELEVLMRMIGHKVLLNMAKDSSSRVLPVQKTDDREYLITFNTQFKLDTKILVETVKEVMEENSMVNSYVVEVFEQNSNDVTYSFKIDPLGLDDMIACRGRDYSGNNYRIKIKLLELKGRELSLNKKNDKASFWWILSGLILLIFVAVLSIFILRKRRAQSSVNEKIPVQIGNYQVNFAQDELFFGQDKIELTGKESNLLALLYQHLNATVERDEILRQVWGDEGDYVGRTLDVFISKLRKKLDQDEAVKIINARGVGYKLVVANSL